MHIGELARRSGVSVKAVRYYEALGLLHPRRAANGYRKYDEAHVRAVVEIRTLSEVGIPALKARPFIECLDAGHLQSDECPASMAVYRDGIVEIDRTIAFLMDRRARLTDRLHPEVAKSDPGHTEKEHPNMSADYTALPSGLPEPEDDGRAAHLPGTSMPSIVLTTSDGHSVDLASLPEGRTIIYLYPLTGRPGVDLPDGWDAIPGARGCSTEACNFRDRYRELQELGVAAIYGLSSQDTAYQAEVVERLHLPFAMLSDPDFKLNDALQLPTFSATGHSRLYARLTLIVRNGMVEHAFYPIFPPNAHAEQVRTWLQQNPI